MQSAINSFHQMALEALDLKANFRKEVNKWLDSLFRSRGTSTAVKPWWLTVCKIESVVCPRVLLTRAEWHPRLETKTMQETIALECTKKCTDPLQFIRHNRASVSLSNSSPKWTVKGSLKWIKLRKAIVDQVPVAKKPSRQSLWEAPTVSTESEHSRKTNWFWIKTINSKYCQRSGHNRSNLRKWLPTTLSNNRTITWRRCHRRKTRALPGRIISNSVHLACTLTVKLTEACSNSHNLSINRAMHINSTSKSNNAWMGVLQVWPRIQIILLKWTRKVVSAPMVHRARSSRFRCSLPTQVFQEETHTALKEQSERTILAFILICPEWHHKTMQWKKSSQNREDRRLGESPRSQTGTQVQQAVNKWVMRMVLKTCQTYIVLYKGQIKAVMTMYRPIEVRMMICTMRIKIRRMSIFMMIWTMTMMTTWLMMMW